jgi:regulator of replication initiation timing
MLLTGMAFVSSMRPGAASAATLPPHAMHKSHQTRLENLRKRHGALKPTVKEHLEEHAALEKELSRLDKALEAASKIQDEKARDEEYKKLDKDIAAVEKRLTEHEGRVMKGSRAFHPMHEGHKNRLMTLRKRHQVLKPTAKEHLEEHAKLEAELSRLDKALEAAANIKDEKARDAEYQKLDKDIAAGEKRMTEHEGNIAKGPRAFHPLHASHTNRLMVLRKRHAALKPVKKEHLDRHAELEKELSRLDKALEAAANIKDEKARDAEYQKLDKDIAAAEKALDAHEADIKK